MYTSYARPPPPPAYFSQSIAVSSLYRSHRRWSCTSGYKVFLFPSVPPLICCCHLFRNKEPFRNVPKPAEPCRWLAVSAPCSLNAWLHPQGSYPLSALLLLFPPSVLFPLLKKSGGFLVSGSPSPILFLLPVCLAQKFFPRKNSDHPKFHQTLRVPFPG